MVGDLAEEKPDLAGLAPDRAATGTRCACTEQFVKESLVPLGINVLILEVDYGFEFKSRPELGCHGITKEQARHLAEVCRENGIRLIPLINCLGHQSWGSNTAALFKAHPEFEETPDLPPGGKLYCREWCPSIPDVNQVVFPLLDELIDAFEADAVHVGMDEVFLIGSNKCPRCKGKDVGELFAGVVNALHEHLVKEKGVEMLMWSDRLLDAGKFSYGTWEASKTGSSRDRADSQGHHPLRLALRETGRLPFRPLFPGARLPRVAFDLEEAGGGGGARPRARKDATPRMLGVLFTGWSAGGNGEKLMAALTDGHAERDRKDNAGQIAATIKAGLKELSGPVIGPKQAIPR